MKLEMHYLVYLMDMVEVQWQSLVEVRCTRDYRVLNRIVRIFSGFGGFELMNVEKGDYEAALKEAFMKTDEDLRAGKSTRVRSDGD
jgi:hypothetical protein